MREPREVKRRTRFRSTAMATTLATCFPGLQSNVAPGLESAVAGADVRELVQRTPGKGLTGEILLSGMR